MTPGTEPALSASEWLSGIDRGKQFNIIIAMQHLKKVKLPAKYKPMMGKEGS